MFTPLGGSFDYVFTHVKFFMLIFKNKMKIWIYLMFMNPLWHVNVM
jgi:hypothetical protein